MYFKQLPIGGYDDNFSYAIGDENLREIFLVDPANYEYLKWFLKKENLKLRAILLTHGHFDHVGVAPRLSKEFGVPIYLNPEDIFLLQEILPDIKSLIDGQVLELGDVSIKVIATPGHTPGSVCFLSENTLLTGDTVFVGGCGRTDFPYSSYDLLQASLEKLKKLPDETVIYPGHDYGKKPVSTIGEQKKMNRHFS